MNAGSLKTSARLQATLAVLSDGAEHSTLAIQLQTRSMAPHSDISGLRANAIRVLHRQEHRIHFYRLAPKIEAGGQGRFCA